ncbi:MAG: EAL domain-containing protein [Candidatus Scalindua sp. AMX11]|nr:MAG: EAL domain-containing protein [Candidatus Scalindua sp.]NOG84334.1 EAL domain-containing protein [Planctomycetota bacterium]RZV74415.1 MAG: GGDEF and EAL domain-containing protein [Candidatus Scalindua sp. SCAELEC01]TDE65335.1 MAG: EAL domain-containing protein [Candidatus Scalindua sp. AMX11]GJQ60756.1 MAG: hypothetical protein SCALA701_35570 [Candidatus Scalindua sp.]
MKKDPNLRRKAEAMIRSKTAPKQKLPNEEVGKLSHELQVYQTQLEMQNEELRKAQVQIEESRQKYVRLYDFAPVGYFTIGEKGLILEVNLTGATMLGLERGVLMKKHLTSFMRREEQDIYYRHRERAFETKKREACELTFKKNDNVQFCARLESIAVRDSEGDFKQLHTIISDITQWKQVQEKLRNLSQAVEQSPSIVIITDINGNIEYVNNKFSQLTGYTSQEVIGKNPRILKSGTITPDVYEDLWKTIAKGGEWEGEFHNKKKDGELYWEHAHILPIKNSMKMTSHYLGVKEDITERKRFEVQLIFLADHDPLTNLYNRRRFHEELGRCLVQSKRYHTTGALLFLDLDNFKYYNDTYGHLKGDELLVKLAGVLKNNIRETDTLARLGGDEFAIILPFAGAEEAQSISQHILGIVREYIPLLENKSLCLTASIGIVLFPEYGSDIDTLLSYADRAMYKAKQQGRNKVCLFSNADKMLLESQQNWDTSMRDALAQNKFVLYLQPIIDISKKILYGYEVLLRMVGEKGEHILPKDFFPLAEQFGHIHSIDRWVICRAIQLIAEYALDRRRLQVTVNVSGKAFTDSELLPMIKEELTRSGINQQYLVFEITESAIIENFTEANNFINTLKEIGCRFALDDFGVGFSTFSYLKHLPVDYLKIDGSFISDLSCNSVDQHLVKAMVEVASGLKKQTIAEFVKNAEVLRLLRTLGVDYAQGYYISAPSVTSEAINQEVKIQYA